LRTSRTRGALALALATAALAPAIAQDRPESLLPPGFGDPAPAPRATPRASGTPRPAPTVAPVPGAVPTAPSTAIVQPLPGEAPVATPSATPSPTPTPDAAELALYEMPLAARRSLALLGPAAERDGGVSAAAFEGADGRFVERLMRRVDAPLPSRWLSILLRRTLASRLTTPRGVNGADFAAERAWLLLRMGEAAAARAVVQGVDTADYTPKLYQVAMNALLATGDPAGLCPLAPGGLAATGERGWVLAGAMCAALAGDQREATRRIAVARRARVASGVDLSLARKVVGAGANGRSAVTIEWGDVVQLTAWRWGLATATGVEVPDTLYATAGAQVRWWQALSPQVPVGLRVAAAEGAAGQGVLSSAALVDLYGAVLDDDRAAAGDSAVAQDLRTAYADRTADGRLRAIRSLWGADAPWPRLVLTARAAARLPAGSATGADADRLVASMLSAGLDRSAARWRGAVSAGGDGWAMIALSDPDAIGNVGYAELSSYAGSGDARARQRLFFAGLAGLGRLSAEDVERGAEALDVRIGAVNSWTRALDRAAAAGEQGSVVVLAATGMQAAGWRGIAPEMLYRVLGALRAVGLGGEARMIAAEAIARG